MWISGAGPPDTMSCFGQVSGLVGLHGGSLGGSMGGDLADRAVMPPPLEQLPADIPKLKVAELKEALGERGLAETGKKAELVARLIEAMESVKHVEDSGDSGDWEAAGRHNTDVCVLLELFRRDDLRPQLLRVDLWGVAGLWRLRGVCRALRSWSTAALAAQPRLMCVSGSVLESGEDFTAGVEVLDLSTMLWSAEVAVPCRPLASGMQ